MLGRWDLHEDHPGEMVALLDIRIGDAMWSPYQGLVRFSLVAHERNDDGTIAVLLRTERGGTIASRAEDPRQPDKHGRVRIHLRHDVPESVRVDVESLAKRRLREIRKRDHRETKAAIDSLNRPTTLLEATQPVTLGGDLPFARPFLPSDLWGGAKG